MIKREKYLAPIREFYDSDLVKIITGVRRCGKSVMLEQVADELRGKTDNIVFLDFEDRATTQAIQTWQDLVAHVDERRSKGLCHVLLDEVQEVEDWHTACRTLRRHDCSVFVTGSNSKLLSREFTKELSGRYVSFRVRPFVYKEVLSYAEELGKQASISDYLVWGGFPKRLEYGAEGLRRYLNDLDETIVANDIINRYKIRKSAEFKKVANYVLVCNARMYSAKAIADYMASQGVVLSTNTVQKWIGYLKEAYVVDEIHRYTKKAKRQLEQSRKLYDCDVALNSIRCTDGRYDLTHNLENIVYNELLYMGYALSVYEANGREIDFMAEKDGKRYYVQVAYSVAEQKTYEREFGAFRYVDQVDKKILITNDDIDYSTSNVDHIRLADFLLLESLD